MRAVYLSGFLVAVLAAVTFWMVAGLQPGATVLQGDFQEQEAEDRTIAAMGGGALNVTGATQTAARSVALTTDPQTASTQYTITVGSAVTDARGTAMSATQNTATFTGVAGNVCTPGVVISTVYGGGGGGGSGPYSRDFVVLHNRTSASINLSGWSIQYAAATSANWSANPLSGSIAAGGYLLIGLATGGSGTSTFTPDLDITTSPLSLSGTNGKVALVMSTTALSGCPTTGFVDMFGYGTASCFEGTVSGALSQGNAATRNGSGCTDTNVNSSDFTVGAVAAPQSSATTANTCTCN